MIKPSRACKRFGLSRHQIRHMRETGKIHGIQDPDSGVWYYDERSLDLAIALDSFLRIYEMTDGEWLITFVRALREVVGPFPP